MTHEHAAPFHTMIFAAGQGTRLRPLTTSRAKPAVSYRGEALIARVARQLEGRSVVINTHHCPSSMRAAATECFPELRVSHEPELLGTAGGLAQARAHLDEGDVLVCNGDIDFPFRVDDVLDAHRKSGAIATLVLVDTGDASDRRVRVQGSRVESILQPPFGAPQLMFTGVQVLSPAALRRLPERGCLVRDAYIPWLAEDAHLNAFVSDAPFRDVGTLEAYLRGHLASLEQGRPHVHSRALVHPSAELHSTWVDADAVIGPHRLERCVVLTGARVEGDAYGTIFTDEGAIQVLDYAVRTPPPPPPTPARRTRQKRRIRAPREPDLPAKEEEYEPLPPFPFAPLIDELRSSGAARVHSSALVHPCASLTRTWVGKGAVIGPVALRECLVADGARVTHDGVQRVYIGESSHPMTESETVPPLTGA